MRAVLHITIILSLGRVCMSTTGLYSYYMVLASQCRLVSKKYFMALVDV